MAGGEAHVAFVGKINEHEFVGLFAPTTSNIETNGGDIPRQPTLNEVVGKAKLVHLHCGVLHVLNNVQWMT